MSRQQMITILKNFQKAPAQGKVRRVYFNIFAERMIYRTTKSENPEVTPAMVKKVLHKISTKPHG